MQKQSAEAARAMEEDKLRQVLPKAVELFNTGKEDSRSFTIKHIKSLLVILFKTPPPKSGPGSRKGEMLKLLIDANQKDPAKIANYSPPAVPSEPPAIPSEPTPVPSDQSSTPPLPNANVQWLCDRIAEARSAGNMGNNISQTLVLAEVALKVIQDIKVEGYDEETNYYDHFFQAFDRSVVQKRDIDFIMDLCSR